MPIREGCLSFAELVPEEKKTVPVLKKNKGISDKYISSIWKSDEFCLTLPIKGERHDQEQKVTCRHPVVQNDKRRRLSLCRQERHHLEFGK